MVNKYYESGEPSLKPYFFYLVSSPSWNHGRYNHIYASLMNPYFIADTQIELKVPFWYSFLGFFLYPFWKAKEELDPTEGRWKIFTDTFLLYKEKYGISYFDDSEESETWIELQGINEHHTDLVVRNLFSDIESRSGSNFPLEIEITPYDKENRRHIKLKTRYN